MWPALPSPLSPQLELEPPFNPRQLCLEEHPQNDTKEDSNHHFLRLTMCQARPTSSD